MTPAELHDKALRAAEWLKARDTVKFHPEIRKGSQVGWLIQALNTGVYFERTDREFIAFCEDRGWQDDHIGDANKMVKADGVEWKTVVESCKIGKFSITVGLWANGFEWGVWIDPLSIVAEGTAPTREEARRQAVEAARGMG